MANGHGKHTAGLRSDADTANGSANIQDFSGRSGFKDSKTIIRINSREVCGNVWNSPERMAGIPDILLMDEPFYSLGRSITVLRMRANCQAT